MAVNGWLGVSVFYSLADSFLCRHTVILQHGGLAKLLEIVDFPSPPSSSSSSLYSPFSVRVPWAVCTPGANVPRSIHALHSQVLSATAEAGRKTESPPHYASRTAPFSLSHLPSSSASSSHPLTLGEVAREVLSLTSLWPYTEDQSPCGENDEEEEEEDFFSHHGENPASESIHPSSSSFPFTKACSSPPSLPLPSAAISPNVDISPRSHREKKKSAMRPKTRDWREKRGKKVDLNDIERIEECLEVISRTWTTGSWCALIQGGGRVVRAATIRALEKIGDELLDLFMIQLVQAMR